MPILRAVVGVTQQKFEAFTIRRPGIGPFQRGVKVRVTVLQYFTGTRTRSVLNTYTHTNVHNYKNEPKAT
jgi:hypothetical protein